MDTTKKIYIAPKLEQIQLDNEIALALQSAPPLGPGETQLLQTPDYFNNDPFYNA